MPDTTASADVSRIALVWIGGLESEIETLPTMSGVLRRLRIASPAEARAAAMRIAREHDGLAVVESSCPSFMAVCGILSRAPSIQVVTVHPTTRCMDSVTLPPPAPGLAQSDWTDRADDGATATSCSTC
jgi:hypothetical protein